MSNMDSSLDMNNYLYKFMAKRSNIKDKNEFIKFYQDNMLILDMIEYCETMNSLSIKSKIISVDTASDFFSYASVCVESESKFKKEINKMKDIIEDSFNEAIES